MILSQTNILTEMVLSMRAQQNEVVTEDLTDIIIKAVSKALSVSLQELKSKSRKDEIVEARFIIFFLLTSYTGLKPREIGEIFNKDRTSVCFGVKTYQKHRDMGDKKFLIKIEKVAVKLEGYINNWEESTWL